MIRTSPKNANRFSGNGCAGLFLIVVGLGLAAIPFQDGVPLGLFRVFYPTLSFLSFELVGLAFLAGGLRALLVGAAFEKSQVEVSPDIRSGKTFQFRYQQFVRQQVMIRAVDTFFVYREKVEWGESGSRSHYEYDRLVSQRSRPVASFQRGEPIELDLDFTAPAGEMGVRNPYMHIKSVRVECLWMVRVRILFGRSSEAWEDHEIAVEESAPSGAVTQDAAAEAGLYDVLLLPIPWENTVAVSNALKEVAPQLTHSGVPYAQQETANLIRERVSEEEADAIAGPLRAAGATVNIVPTESTWWIPIGGEARFDGAASSQNKSNG